jgi:2-phospho-L-lactate/phosphoenolpyruvate guanylyltransferase
VEPPVRADLARTWAVVPIRGLETAKTRLGGDLDAEERVDLVIDLLSRTLRATRDSKRIAGTIVVTMDPAAAGIARDHDAVGLVERAPGLDAAITAARSVAIARGATAVLVLPADLPAIDSAAVDAIVDASARALAGARSAAGARTDALTRGIVAIVGDRHGTGTNALLVSPPALVEPAFGPESRARHGSAAIAAGATLLELDGPLSLDVDTGEDLLAAEAALGGTRG